MNEFDLSKSINKILNNIKNKNHKKEIEEYLYIRERVDKVSPSSRNNDVHALISLSTFLKTKPFDKAIQDDLIKWEIYQEKKNMEKTTIGQYGIHIKRFYRYLADKETYKKGKKFQKTIPYPDNVSWMLADTKNQKELPLDRVLTHEELLRMLNTCDNLRDQAMIVSFADGGLRNSELVSLNTENLGFDKLGAYFILPKNGKDLKTGARKIRLFLVPSSTQYLREYKNKHPFKKFDKAPLFYTKVFSTCNKVMQKTNDGTVTLEDLELLRMAKNSVKDVIKNIAKRAKVPINSPHDLRHVSATWCSKAGFNEHEMRIRFGWTPNSTMPSRYTHLTALDVDDKIKIITGFKEPDKPEDTILQPKLCPNCDYENQPTNVVCGRCGMKLDISKEEITMTATETGLGVQDMIKDKEFMMKMMNLMASEWQKLQQEKKKA